MTPFVGQIQAFGFNFAPRGWAKCDGTLLAISQYNALFSLLGTMYGGDGRTTFALPDLRSRSIVHTGTGPGLDTITQGERGGKISETLSILNLPSHNHAVSVNVNTGGGSEPAPTGIIASQVNGFAEDPTSGAKLGGVTESNVGGGQSFNIRNPYLGIEYCVALEGVYPSRN
jgi:microcystin-dependent protein